MDELPMEIIVHIFKYLSKKEQIKVSGVNKKFREALFSPPLWTECEERHISVPVSQVTSFRKFLKQIPWLRHLNIQVNDFTKLRPPIVNLTTVFKLLKNLECVTLQTNLCKPSMAFFPSIIKHITLYEGAAFENNKFITDYLLSRIADSCPQLEHFQVIQNNFPYYTRKGMTYLLKKLTGSLQTFILLSPYDRDPFLYFLNCPPSVTTLCLKIDFDYYIYDENQMMLSNLENLQTLALADESWRFLFENQAISSILVNCSLKSLRFLYLAGCWQFDNEDFVSTFTKLPNLQILILDDCTVSVDVLARFFNDCSSLKQFMWKKPGGFSKSEKIEIQRLQIEISRPVYFFISSSSKYNFNKCVSFPNDSSGCLKAFYHLLMDIFDAYKVNYYLCNAPIVKKSKAFFRYGI